MIDLMQALQKSLGELPQRKPATIETETESKIAAVPSPKKAAGKRTPRAANG